MVLFEKKLKFILEGFFNFAPFYNFIVQNQATYHLNWFKCP